MNSKNSSNNKRRILSFNSPTKNKIRKTLEKKTEFEMSERRSLINSVDVDTCRNDQTNIDSREALDSAKILRGNPSDSLSQDYHRLIRPYIDVIDELRKFGLQEEINLPNVVIIGDQSSGKTSILEAISGIQLPRGTDMVTRCPLELRLKRVLQGSWKATLSYKNLRGSPTNLVFTEPKDVKKYILDAQNAICGTNKSVSAELITLQIESPSTEAPDLTLIDLPGIIRIPVNNQPKDIVSKTKKIINTYVGNVNTVMLCVVSADNDAAVNESISIAKDVDPRGERTIGVITKPDLTEETNKKSVICLFNNEKIFLEKGYHMVKCRNQTDLNRELSLDESVANEKLFFDNDRVYRSADRSRMGTQKLSSKITEELVTAIKKNIPMIKDKVNYLLSEAQNNLASLPKEIPENDQAKLTYLTMVMTQMTKDLELGFHKGKVSWSRENLFCFWRDLFDEMTRSFEKIREDAMRTRFQVTNLRQEIAKQRGNEIIEFLNFDLFENLIKEHVSNYQSAANFLLLRMRNNAEETLIKTIEKNFKNIPKIESHLKKIAEEELRLSNKTALRRIELIFEEEKLIFASDKVFYQEMENLKTESEKPSSGLSSIFNFFSNEIDVNKKIVLEKTQKILNIITCYLKIVHARLSDVIPMAIRQCLHIELCRNVSEKFIQYSTLPENVRKIKESEKICDERQKLKERIKIFEKAQIELLNF